MIIYREYQLNYRTKNYEYQEPLKSLKKEIRGERHGKRNPNICKSDANI